MAASNGYIGHGTTFQLGTATFAQVDEINAPEIEVDDVEITNMDSDDGYKEYIPGLIDGGSIGITLIFDAGDTTGQGTIKTKVDARATEAFTLTLPTATGAVWTGNGYLKGMSQPVPKDDKIMIETEMKVTGKPTLTIT